MLAAPGSSPPQIHEDAELRRQIRGERIRMLFAPTVPMTVVGALVSIALAWVIHEHTGQSWGIAWAALCVLAAAARLLHLRSYQRSAQRDHPMWLSSLTLMCALQGCAWGALGLLMPTEDLVICSVVASTLVGACAVCTFNLQAHFHPNLANNLPTLIPVSLMLLSRQDSYGLFGGFGLLALLALLLFESRRAKRRITELLSLRFTTDRIARERSQALVLAQRHSAVKDQFLATMSHEMRTPLHGILGLARLLLSRLPHQSGPQRESRHHVELIEHAGDHLLTLINDVLDFSRIEAGKLHIQNEPFDLHALLKDLIELHRVGAREKGLSLLSNVRLPQPCWVSGDASRLRQMLHNLLGNAVKFTVRGQIRVHAAVAGPSSDLVVFQLQDSGAGIPHDQLDRIFDPFHQLDGSHARQQNGTGLGLTITRELARAMGGDVTCESEMGKGSVFTLTLPLTPEAEQASQVAPDTSESAPRLASRLSGRILLVEDNPVNALVAEANLTQLGLTVSHAEDGQQALSLLTQGDRPFNLVLMDLQMPRLDGMETTRRLRRWEGQQGVAPIPVVALTANALSTDRALCLAAGMDDHLAKPFKPEELDSILQRHLNTPVH
jgi:signal transduction histidine kinase/ActR/RegA family two-component response regulator